MTALRQDGAHGVDRLASSPGTIGGWWKLTGRMQQWPYALVLRLAPSKLLVATVSLLRGARCKYGML